MKATINNLILGILFFASFPAILFSQDCYWSSCAKGTLSDVGNRIATDHLGNVYVAGWTESHPCFFNTDTIYPNGSEDIFLVKYDISGNEVWIRQFGGDNESPDDYEFVRGIVFDSINQNLLILGNFYNQLTLPDTTLFGDEMTMFILKMDMNGNVIWIRSGGGFAEDCAFGLTYDPQGNVYVSGSNSNPANFGGIEIPPGGFLAKYDQDGNILWVKHKFRYWSLWPQSPYYPYTESVPVSILFNNGHLLVNGEVQNDTIIIDTITRINPPGFRASFIGTFSPQGDIEFLTFAGGPSGEYGSQFAVDQYGNAYITGNFKDMGYFGHDTLYDHGLSDGDCFISKLDSNGNFIWTRQLFATGEAHGYGVCTDRSGSVYVSGHFIGEAQFGETILTSESIGTMDAFLTHFSPEGVCWGVRHYYPSIILALQTDPEGNIFMVGAFDDSLVLGPYTYYSMGESDMFVAKCSPITGIGEVNENPANELLIYANPSTGVCNVTIPDELRNEKNLRLRIYDQTGKLVQESKVDLSVETIRLDIRAQATGIYQIVITNGKKTYSGRIVFRGN